MANEMVLASDVNVDELKRIGTMLALSGYFETAQARDVAVAQMCVKVMAGRELGFGPFASVNGIHVIKGKPAVSANLMAAAVKANPRYDYRVRQMDNEAARIEFFEIVDGKRESLGISEFTRADAKAAGTQNMDRFGRNMMFARAMSNGVKWYAPDVFNGSMVYVPEELGASVDGDGNVIDVDYRSVDKATGEVLSTTTQAAPEPKANGKAAPTEAELLMRSVDAVEAKHHGYNGDMVGSDLPAVVAEWQTPDDAFMWAIGQGAVDGGVPHAKNLLKKIAEPFGGLKRSNAAEVYTAFYHECLKRAADAEQQAAAAHDDDEVGNLFEEVAEMAA